MPNLLEVLSCRILGCEPLDKVAKQEGFGKAGWFQRRFTGMKKGMYERDPESCRSSQTRLTSNSQEEQGYYMRKWQANPLGPISLSIKSSGQKRRRLGLSTGDPALRTRVPMLGWKARLGMEGSQQVGLNLALTNHPDVLQVKNSVDIPKSLLQLKCGFRAFTIFLQLQ